MKKIKDKIFKRLTFDYLEGTLMRFVTKLLQPIYIKYIVPRKVKNLRKQKVIKVLFVLHELGSWKTENLYLRMKRHTRFNVQLLLVPTNEKYSLCILKEYLENKGYSYGMINKGECIKKKIHPDIIFYTKPYDGILHWKYFYTNNLYALFCNVTYSFRNRNSPHLKKIKYGEYIWQEYVENDKIIEEKITIQNINDKKFINTGLPIMDTLKLNKSYFENPWIQMTDNKKRIIYAPHHTLKVNTETFLSPFYYATFLEYANFMLEMVEKYQDKVQWTFKPHPLLRSKLYQIWGTEKTDAYYKRWSDMENCQINEGEYMGLFKHSDAMIHDCGSFKLEYLYTDNPVMYLLKDNPEYDYENWQTTRALELHYKGRNKEDIEKFILNVINGKDEMKGERKKFVDKYLTPPNGKTACENIIHAILGEEEYS